MKILEDRIMKDGIVLNKDILKVGSFLNHQIDTDLLSQIGEEIARIYKNDNITKVLTIEASGIAFAVAAGHALHCPAVFAKKGTSANISGSLYSAEIYSFTHNTSYHVTLPIDYLSESDRVIIVDDFLANGKALEGLIDIIKKSGATFVGATCAVEKGFQGGGDALRAKGYRIESLVIVDEMRPGYIRFRALD